MGEQPTGQVEYRSATLTDVSWPERTIELIVMPYEVETVVGHHGRAIREIVAAGAFDGIERRANRVRVNLEHDVNRTIGRAVAFHPKRPEGLVAELRIAKTQLGDDTLVYAEDGILDASAGFVPMPGGETWPEKGLRRLTKCWLAHVALTAEPAYTGTEVLSVRSSSSSSSPTPNLDLVAGWRLEDLLASDPKLSR